MVGIWISDQQVGLLAPSGEEMEVVDLPPRFLTCRWCHAPIQAGVDGVFRAASYADLDGYCSGALEERHVPRI